MQLIAMRSGLAGSTLNFLHLAEPPKKRSHLSDHERAGGYRTLLILAVSLGAASTDPISEIDKKHRTGGSPVPPNQSHHGILKENSCFSPRGFDFSKENPCSAKGKKGGGGREGD